MTNKQHQIDIIFQYATNIALILKAENVDCNIENVYELALKYAQPQVALMQHKINSNMFNNYDMKDIISIFILQAINKIQVE